jgi:hypothetical protein
MFFDFLHRVDAWIYTWTQKKVHVLERRNWAEREELIEFLLFLAWFPLLTLLVFVLFKSDLNPFFGVVVVIYYVGDLYGVKSAIKCEKMTSDPRKWNPIKSRFLNRVVTVGATGSLSIGFLTTAALVAWKGSWDMLFLILFVSAGPLLVTVLEYLICTKPLPHWERSVHAAPQNA